MKDKLKTFEDTDRLLRESLKLISFTNDSLVDPIRHEMAFISKLKQLDLEVQKARDSFSQTLNLNTVDLLMKDLQRETTTTNQNGHQL
jgi:transposase